MKTPQTHTVYTITNRKTGRTYYGKTKDFGRRIEVHVYYLTMSKRHYNRDLQQDWNTLGAKFFSFNVVNARCTKDHAAALEKSLIMADLGCYNEKSGPGTSKFSAQTRANFRGGERRKAVLLLDRETVKEILSLKGHDHGYAIAAKYQVSSATVSKIHNGKYDPMNRLGLNA